MTSLQGYVFLDYTLIKINERPLRDVIITSELDGEKFSLFDCKFDLDNPAMPSGTEEIETVSISHYPLGEPLKRSTQGSVSVGKYCVVSVVSLVMCCVVSIMLLVLCC